MVDPLAEIVSLLQPGAPFSKLVVATAPWAIRRADTGRPFFFVVLDGCCHLTIDSPAGSDTLTLNSGDFVLIPAARSFATSSVDRPPPREDETVTTRMAHRPWGVRVGDPDGVEDVRMLVGNCLFGSPDAALLVPLLPQWIHVSGENRLATLVQLVGDESRADRPARDIVTARLLEVLLIEAFRSTATTASSPGLVRGLADPRLAHALRCMHERPAAPWTVAQLAREAAISRSSFFERFSRAIGIAPMEYLLAWRMALAKQLLLKRETAMAEIAERVGYSSVSAFGVAFTRHVGVPPGRYAKGQSG
ncbi:AraC family transcriptional regulator [Achromobacter aloeverae]|uniref:AraC family transcriptional regulator n=1 Tax=Achromobacter aloeverae TaxID=1750518 RepID=A0A4Q1HM08_9BURK|nr:AraC family transcriptional regulator [Achromobacter aloeverae]RXN91388.1 AraC family transcriptional regulator [Achromobacter aloeverae]